MEGNKLGRLLKTLSVQQWCAKMENHYCEKYINEFVNMTYIKVYIVFSFEVCYEHFRYSIHSESLHE